MKEDGMSKDDEEWKPEDDGLEKQFMKEGLKFLRQGAKQLGGAMGHVVGAGMAPGNFIPGPVPQDNSITVTIRAIQNGFIMSYVADRKIEGTPHVYGVPVEVFMTGCKDEVTAIAIAMALIRDRYDRSNIGEKGPSHG